MAAAGPTQVINANIRLNVICMSCAYGWYLFGGKAKTNAQLSIQEIIPTVAGRLSSKIDFMGLTRTSCSPADPPRRVNCCEQKLFHKIKAGRRLAVASQRFAPAPG